MLKMAESGAENVVHFPDPDLTAKADMAKDQWANIIRVQIHFNELIHRTRQVTATVVLATYGSAAAFFASHPTAMWNIKSLGASFHVVSPIILLGILFLLVGWATDRKYYFKLLISSVEVGEEIERRFDFPAKLTIKLSSSVNRLHAKFTVYLFYFAALLAGILLFLFVNFSTVSGL